MKKIIIILSAIWLGCGICYAGVGDTIKVTKITLLNTALSLEKDKTIEIKVKKIEPDSASNKDVTWISSEITKATVNNTGKVTAKAVGTTTITATAKDGSGIKATCTVTVTAAAVLVESVTIDDTVRLTASNTKILTETVSPPGAINKKVTWRSTQETVATVKDGKVTAISEGTAEIIVTTNDGKKTDTCIVIVSPIVSLLDDNKISAPDSILILQDNIRTLKDENAELKANQNPIPAFVSYILAGLLLVLIVFLVIILKKHKKELAKQKENAEEALNISDEEEKKKKDELEKLNKGLNDKIKDLEFENKNLRADLNSKPAQTPTTFVSAPVSNSVSLSKSLYADAINEQNGLFNRVTESPNEDTVFELKLNNAADKTAKFTIYERACPRVLKNNDFAAGCEMQKITSSPSRLDVEQGTVELQDNGKWKITAKAKVKFV
ncbi:MAG: Ig-like domain-containing protein [Prevotellaceae bacterium]|jgi:preprotein translocase subunit SecG|nr:Ig-like domain-containing protein [Prevotellaceae bacterium]